MFNSILPLSSLMNATGNETELLSAIEKEAINYNLDYNYDDIGNLTIRLPGKGVKKKKILISCTVDVYGFICLATDKGKCFLASTRNLDTKRTDKFMLVSETKKQYRVSMDKNDNYFVRSKVLKVGDYLKEQVQYKTDKNLVSGKFIGKYALIYALTCLFQEKPENDIVLCFAVKGESNCPSQANAAGHQRPDFALLIGTAPSNSKFPLIVLKDGKIFSDPSLVEKAKSRRVKTQDYVSDSKNAVTKAESIVSCASIPTLTLALPCRNLIESQESIEISTCKKLIDLIRSLCNIQF